MAVATCCIEVQTEPGLEEQLVKAEAVEEAAKEEEQEDVEDNCELPDDRLRRKANGQGEFFQEFQNSRIFY